MPPVKELLLLLLVAPIGLLVVLNQGLGTMAPVAVPVSTPAAVGRLEPTPVPTLAVQTASGLVGIVEVAKSWLGVRYAWGGCSRQGVDCSCFVQNVLAVVGIHAPRITTQQKAWAIPVSASELQIGDLVFFDNTCDNCGANPTHVGLYIGAGLMINAGDPVQIAPAINSHFSGAGRPH